MPGAVAGARVDHSDGSTDRRLTATPGGSFTTPWRVVVVATWVMVIIAYAAVWKTSEELGIGMWWLGTRSDPSMALIRLLPFAVAAVPAVAAAYNLPWSWWASLGAAAVLLLVAVPDFSRSTGLALLELAIALAALLVTASAWTGRTRTRAAATPGGPDRSEG